MSTRQLDRIIAAVNASERYRFPLTDGVPDFRVVRCADCSSRTTEVRIPSDEIVEHDAWHVAE
jgi:hypothetical protein